MPSLPSRHSAYTSISAVGDGSSERERLPEELRSRSPDLRRTIISVVDEFGEKGFNEKVAQATKEEGQTACADQRLRLRFQDEEDARWHALIPGTEEGGSWFVEAWDVYMVIFTFVVQVFTPFSLCLYAPTKEPPWHSVMNTLLTLSMTLDIVFHFCVAKSLPQDSASRDLWLKDIRPIAVDYCKLPCFSNQRRCGWFYFDATICIPGWCFVFRGEPGMCNPLLLLCLFRLLVSENRQKRLKKVIESLHAIYGFPLFTLEVLKFVLLTTLTCHWIACSWVLFEGKITAGYFSLKGVRASWLSALIDSKGDSCEPSAAEDPLCVYLIAYYWAVMTLTTVGYGDITPQNKVEYLISIVCMVAVSYIWAYIVGSIVAILSDLDPSSREFRHNMDYLVDFMKRRGLASDLQVQLRTYLYKTRGLLDKTAQRHLVEQFFSEGLQRQVVTSSMEASFLRKGVYWMSSLDDDAVMDIVRQMQDKGYGPEEVICLRGALCLVQTGFVGLRGRLLKRGDCWGFNDVLLETPQLLDSTMPRTLNYVELLVLSRTSLLEVAEKYPEADRRLRKAQVRTAVARAMVFLAAKHKAASVRFFQERGGSMRPEDSEGVRLKDLVFNLHSGLQESCFSLPASRNLGVASKEEEQYPNEQIVKLLEDMLKKQNLLAAQVKDLSATVAEKQAKEEALRDYAANLAAQVRPSPMSIASTMLGRVRSPARASTLSERRSDW